MKKFALFVIAGIALMSCKKDYVCSCKSTSSVPGYGTADSSFTIDIPKSKKKDAEAKCKGNESSVTGSYMGISFSYTTTCSI